VLRLEGHDLPEPSIDLHLTGVWNGSEPTPGRHDGMKVEDRSLNPGVSLP
jgi:hypothetical protein